MKISEHIKKKVYTGDCFHCETKGYPAIGISSSDKYICEECLIKIKQYGLRPLRQYIAVSMDEEIGYNVEALSVEDAIDNIGLFFGPAAATSLKGIAEDTWVYAN